MTATLPIGSLSPRLTLAEFVSTSHREFLEEQANPPMEVLVYARRWAEDIWEPVSFIWGRTHLNSGYRCDGLNRAVGGSPNSAHRFGRAGDCLPLDADLAGAMALLVGSDIAFDKAIYELGRWIHIQIPTRGAEPRRHALMTFDGKFYQEWDPSDPRVVGS